MEVKKITTEEKIINASYYLLKNEGISKVTTKRIAQKAGVSEVTIFRKFKTKDNLIKLTKEHYLNNILEKIDEIFYFDNNILVEEYLKNTFKNVLTLSEKSFDIFKIAMEEVYYVSSTKKIILTLSSRIIDRLTEYFTYQIQEKRIRHVNPKILAMNIFSMLFESIIIRQIYGDNPINFDYYADDFLDILINGIKKSEVNDE